ncbi:MAG TPA: pyruvate:ferredoxin (flavodoxin) oxidoreductase [Anaerolineales bacterium]|nr:pyruvate:ferredoxin (flavodoxin) oxidoreductase [Anaerolineales bacterium]
MSKQIAIVDGNEAVASVAYRTNEVIAIYPITPASAMGEYADLWAAEGKPNVWGSVPSVIEMQSEGGAAGAVHGALQAGSLATTFTASQGLLLMIPNMYKIAGELTPAVFHIAARTIAAHALSIFGDHSDVMAARQTGWALLASNSVQEAHDLALIAEVATLEARIPFLHFFDGFRTSHEIGKIKLITDEIIRKLLPEDKIHEHRQRALTPERPVVRGTAQNPDHFFQGREAANPYYAACPEIVQKAMDAFAAETGRRYNLFDYYGAPGAERAIVLMGSGAGAVEEAVDALQTRGEKVGVLKVRLYRPFSPEHFLAALPPTVRSLAVLDRCKEPGAVGEPLYLDVQSAFREAPLGTWAPKVIGGRFGLSSKEFTPAMAAAVFAELGKAEPKLHFSVGIKDDVSHQSLDVDPEFSADDATAHQAIFFGLGSDGTVSANKASIKIIGEETDKYVQGYFSYDSKKAGTVTESHLRFGGNPIRSTYLVERANFVACHQFGFLEKFDVLEKIDKGGTFLLNSPFNAKEVWENLPRLTQEHIIDKKLKFYVIDANKLADEIGLGGHINTSLQTCFFHITGVIPEELALGKIREAIHKSYGKKGEKVVAQNIAAVDQALARLEKVEIPQGADSQRELRGAVSEQAPEFVRSTLGAIIERRGNSLPVSAFPVDGTFPVGTTQWEKRALADEIPVWDPQDCIQCGKCVFVCPHAVIREKVYAAADLVGAPVSFQSVEAHWKEFPDQIYTLQVSPEDCTGCTLCVDACPVTDKVTGKKPIEMQPIGAHRETEKVNWEYFLTLPEVDRSVIKLNTVKNSQLLQPLFEFSGACSGCGETPYLKLISQLYGERAIIANATGCSSIYGANLPTTPWAKNREGRGPAWANSLFEDNAEFGLGIRISLDKQEAMARELLAKLSVAIGPELVQRLLTADQSSEAGISEQRLRVAELKGRLSGVDNPEARNLMQLADALVKKVVWIVGGDGWAYDIGYGGLDHVLASGRKVNILVMDTEVYSNTGGQASKATPRASTARFAVNGKETAKKNLGLLAISYGSVYVASIAMGASDAQTMKAITEAEAYNGPALVIAYAHCVEHGIEMTKGLQEQNLAVESGMWPLYRYNPDLAAQGKPALILDSKEPSISVKDYIYNENRYRRLVAADEERAEQLLAKLEKDVQRQRATFKRLAQGEELQKAVVNN